MTNELATILAACLAGFIALIGMVIAKDQKTSEFRQAWIDALRSELADLLSHHWRAHFAQKYARGRALADAIALNQEGAARAKAKIMMRLNPEEHGELIQEVTRFESLIDPRTGTTFEELLQAEGRLTSSAARALKTEWERVKSGEPIFKYLRGGLILSLATAAWIGFFVLAAYGLQSARLP